ncbi:MULTISPECIES: c-type cytochrome [Mesorhizobium]|uniref:c-type cytochrome n=1 Tax=Mesorhizobium TaxID=68287 RepID=UPI000FE9378C|nr:c-type cytochrome [Mesorhizobium sp.]RWA66571.1 MAG: c-type cytochrome [Mesorhizobium sp.]TIW75095.1 MAG: c-type cytochrome [Mesorhizobium sp.]TIX43647.1 MAG: c-type cytochrome [Mesorhizobium sp.]
MPDLPTPLSGRAALIGIALVAASAAFATINIARDNHSRAAVAKAITDGDPARAPEIFRRYGCSGCHTIAGIPGADGQTGAPLTGLSKRLYIAGVLENNSDNLVAWIVSPRSFSPRTAMPATGISQQEAKDLAAYLYAQ